MHGIPKVWKAFIEETCVLTLASGSIDGVVQGTSLATGDAGSYPVGIRSLNPCTSVNCKAHINSYS
jgi:hypothetical protein